MDTKKLRQKILDLAIRGKLVPQDPSDEPASLLLERIHEEKERLIKEGKIKRSKKTATEGEIEAPFEIPESWEWTDIESFTYDLQYGTSEKSSAEGEVPVLRMGNITRVGTVDFTDLVYSSNKDDISKYALLNDDLLFNRTNSSEWVGKTAIYKSDSPAIYAGYLIRVRCILVCPDFINFVLNSSYHRDWCNQVKTDAVNQSNINAQKLSKHLIPIPPYKEQLRIANEVERWFAVIDALESNEGDLLKAIDQAKSKILDLAIHGKLVPQEGEWKELKIRDAFIINPKNKEADEKLAGFVPMSNIQDGYRNSFVCETKPWGTIKKGFTHFADGDIAVAKISPCLENRKSMVLADLPNGIGAGTTELIVFRCKEEVFPKYGLYFFKTQFFIDSCVGTFNGVVGQQRVGKNIVEEIAFPLPPYQEQLRIVAKIEELFGILDGIKEALEA